MALAGSAATTLVGLMISDSWAHTKDKLARFFARSGAEDEIAETLDTARAELVAARETGDAPREADIKAEWNNRLRVLLQSDPSVAEELQHLIRAGDARSEACPRDTVRNVVSGGKQFGPVIQTGRISTVAFAAPEAGSAPDEPLTHGGEEK
jgi:hypothetical protein